MTMKNVQKKFSLNKTTKSNFITYGIVVAAFVIMEILMAAGMVSSLLKGLLVPICVYVIMAISLNLTVGILGELSLGHAGFMSVGAFTGIVVTTALAESIPSDGLRLTIAMVVAAAAAALVGVIVGVPVLRLSGDYLAIVTLAACEIIKSIVNVLYVGLDSNGLHLSIIEQSFSLEDGGKMIINGPIGVSGIDKISTFTAGIVLVLVTLFVVLNLINSRHGRAIMAVRDNKIAADSIGISTTRYKLLANTSILILVFVVLGGLGNIFGSVIAAALLTLLPELLRKLNFNDYRMLIYAILLIALMLFNNSKLKQRLLDWRSGKKAAKTKGEVA